MNFTLETAKMKTTTRRLALAGLGALMLLTSACAPPKIMISQGFAGDKSSQYLMRPAGSNDDQKMYNFYIRICDLADDASTSNCQDTLLLENVTNKPL